MSIRSSATNTDCPTRRRCLTEESSLAHFRNDVAGCQGDSRSNHDGAPPNMVCSANHPIQCQHHAVELRDIEVAKTVRRRDPHGSLDKGEGHSWPRLQLRLTKSRLKVRIFHRFIS